MNELRNFSVLIGNGLNFFAWRSLSIVLFVRNQNVSKTISVEHSVERTAQSAAHVVTPVCKC